MGRRNYRCPNNSKYHFEITLRTEVAIPAIRMISDAFPKAIVGAGTVSTPEQILLARDSGASFVVKRLKMH